MTNPPNLKTRLKNLKLNFEEAGEGVEIALDKKENKLVVIVDVGTRRGATSQLKSIKLATLTHKWDNTKTLSLNAYDKKFNNDELDELDEEITRRAKEANIRKKGVALK